MDDASLRTPIPVPCLIDADNRVGLLQCLSNDFGTKISVEQGYRSSIVTSTTAQIEAKVFAAFLKSFAFHPAVLLSCRFDGSVGSFAEDTDADAIVRLLARGDA